MDELPVILVVEDEVALQDFVRDALTDAGFDLKVSPSAEEGLALLRNGAVQYRALLTDINLGRGMNGWADQGASKGVPK